MPAERELVRRQAGQVEQEEKPKRARFRKAQRVKDKTHQGPFPAHKHAWRGKEAHAQGGVSLQEEVQSHRSEGLGDAVMWRGEMRTSCTS